MAWSLKDSTNIYLELRNISSKILTSFGMMTEPHKPIARTCKWKYGRPLGILYHYTGGPDGLKSMRWCNDPGWGNTSSSWHVTIFDRMPNNSIGEIWSNIDDELRVLFPVPVVIMADWRWGTWHGNWTCNMTLGVENRNTGYSGWMKLGNNGIEKLGKEPIEVCGRKWEPYTREQIVANVNIGQLANGWTDGQMDPDWILPHQAVWAIKADTGLVHPLHTIRDEIFNPSSEDKFKHWLTQFEMAPDDDKEFDDIWEVPDIDRGPVAHIDWKIPGPNVEPAESDDWVALSLYKIGFHTSPKTPSPNELAKQVRWFQRSTEGYKKINHPEWILNPDGVVGNLTKAGIDRRLQQLKLAT